MEQPTPTRQQLAQQVLELAQSRLLADLRFFSPSLEKLRPAACSGLQGTPLASDGQTLFYDPDELLRAFRAQRQRPVRALLHLLLHWMLGHPFQPQEKDGPLWSLACDAAVEQIIAELDLPSCRLADDPVRRERLLRLRESCPNMTAVQLYNHWLAHRPDPETLQALAALFMQDAHALWHPRRLSAPRRAGKPGPGEVGEPTDEQDEQPAAPADDKTEQALLRRRQETLRREWKQIARQAEADLKTFSRRYGRRAGSLMDNLAPITFEECDYSEFLRRFGAENEVLHVSEDEFDLIYYTYGLKTYGNVPLVEPLEYREESRIREFVIVIDTSGSVQGDIVQSFLQRTCDVLRQSGSFTRQVNIYLLQCDAEVQSVERLTDLDQLAGLIPRLRLRGFGGTDFRPAFAYVEQLLQTRQLTKLDGLLYFTDGVGTYPDKAPDYKTAFIFNRDDAISPRVPSWAIRAVLTTDTIRLLPVQTGEEDA